MARLVLREQQATDEIFMTELISEDVSVPLASGLLLGVFVFRIR